MGGQNEWMCGMNGWQNEWVCGKNGWMDVWNEQMGRRNGLAE